jgi:SAM-dependent methyltransferase
MQSPQFELHADIERRHWWFKARRRILRSLLGRLLAAGGKTTILDIGCGTGGNIGALAKDYPCAGVDSSPQAIELARGAYPEVRFICGSLSGEGKDLGEMAGVLLLMDVLEHVPDDARFLREILSVMRPGAYLLITVPADMALWSRHDESFGHFRRYDRQSLARLWEGLPASALLLSYYNARLYPFIRLTRVVTRLRGRTFGRAGTDFRIPSPPVNAFLEGIFAGEERVLADLLEGRRSRGFSRGASLIALLRREAGSLPPSGPPPGGAPHER